ncbi:unnamed protein product [Toxocara canis]|uniref:Secreted protein n=1 Tax=Toxocara canis TaxID=6265 RepID=A0A183UQM7_TOXCA|nr:unnamed protein product [Toxocara canis]
MWCLGKFANTKRNTAACLCARSVWSGCFRDRVHWKFEREFAGCDPDVNSIRPIHGYQKELYTLHAVALCVRFQRPPNDA